MVNPINETGNVSANAEAVNKRPNKAAPKSGDAFKPEVVGQAVLKPDESEGPSGIKTSGREGADLQMVKDTKGEVRKSEISDGELTINVYDSSGKLLRKIPPGYLPAGEQQFDITV